MNPVEPEKPSFLRRAVAILVLVVVAVIAVRLAVGFVAGIVSAVFWIAVVIALVVAVLWARSALKKPRRVKRSATPEISAPPENPIEAEMRRQLREQGRR